MQLEAVIGLETHIELSTKSKMFCSCSTDFGAKPNHHTCPVCLALPGALPVMNKQTVEYGIKLALALGCSIHSVSRFDRKQYFYPDLPKGYQISQYEYPAFTGGTVMLSGDRKINLTRIHIEEDAGKNIHGAGADNHSYVDLNRAGVPLLEMVTEPEIRTPEEASEFLRRIRQIVRYLRISDGNMEQGSLRCDANISLRPKSSGKLGKKVEIKNINSFKHVEKALKFEIKRQRDLILGGGTITQETRLFNAHESVTYAMRSKEDSFEYRYFPEPDLPLLNIAEEWIRKVSETIPELPDEKRRRFAEQYGITDYDAGVLTDLSELADYYEACCKKGRNSAQIAHLISTELLAITKKTGMEFSAVKPEYVARISDLIDENLISIKIAKQLFPLLFETRDDPDNIIKTKGLIQISDSSEIEKIIESILEGNKGNVEKFKAGKTKILGFFVGQVMKETKGKANPKLVNRILIEKLSAVSDEFDG